jgi:hypothetical protein
LRALFKILFPLFLSFNAFAAEHNHLGAHVHGALKLEIAVEGNSIFFDLDGPAEAILGFEYVPKTDAEKKVLSDANLTWRNQLLSKILVLDPKLNCKVSEVLFNQEIESNHDAKNKSAAIHSDIEAQAKYVCSENLKGKILTVALKKHFPHIKKLTIELIGSEIRSIDSKTVEEVKL